MEERKLKAIFGKDGRGSTNSKTTIPIRHFRDMGITPEDREFEYYYDDKNKIIFLSKNRIKNIKLEIEYEK